MKSQAILFDFGGTLDADGIHWSTRFYAHYQRAGLAIDRRTFDSAFIRADRAIAHRDIIETMSFWDLLHLQVELQMQFLRLDEPRRSEEIVQSCFEETKVIIARNARILAWLSRMYALGVVSNFTGNLATVCREFGLDRFFEVVLDSKIVGISKPDPRLFQLALKELSRSPLDCYFVGDSFERDIIPAKLLGMRTVWLRGAEAGLCPDSAKVDFTIASLTELIPILGNHHV